MGADVYFIGPGQDKLTPEQTAGWLSTDEEVGYYRDSYNAASTLWRLGLSWWDDIGGLLDDSGNLDADGARRVLALIESRNQTFEENLAEVSALEQGYYREDLAVFKRLLQRVIDTPASMLNCWL